MNAILEAINSTENKVYAPLGSDGKDILEDIGPRDPDYLNLGFGALNPTALQGCHNIIQKGFFEALVCIFIVDIQCVVDGVGHMLSYIWSIKCLCMYYHFLLGRVLEYLLRFAMYTHFCDEANDNTRYCSRTYLL